MSGGDWALIVVALIIIGVVLLGPSLRAMAGRLPEVAASILLALGIALIANGITAVFHLRNQGTAVLDALQDQLWPIVSGTVLTSIAVLNIGSRARRRRNALQELRAEHEKELRKVRDANREEWKEFIGTDLVTTLRGYGRALLLPDSVQRNEGLRHAQAVTLWMASTFVGRRGTRTRACLYRHDVSEKKLVPIDGLYSGGEHQCTRHFGEGHPTYDEIKRGNPVIRMEISEEEVKRDNLSYRSFIAHPVSVKKGEVYGALMVDCRNAGDLDEEVDRAKVAVLAALLSATFYVRQNTATR